MQNYQNEDNQSDITDISLQESEDSFVQIIHQEIQHLKQQIELERFMHTEEYMLLEQNCHTLETRLNEMVKEKQILLLLLQSKQNVSNALPIAPGLP
jgi:hypothetical protein